MSNLELEKDFEELEKKYQYNDYFYIELLYLANERLSQKSISPLNYKLEKITEELEEVIWEFFKVGYYFPCYLDFLKSLLDTSIQKVEEYIQIWEEAHHN